MRTTRTAAAAPARRNAGPAATQAIRAFTAMLDDPISQMSGIYPSRQYFAGVLDEIAIGHGFHSYRDLCDEIEQRVGSRWAHFNLPPCYDE